MSTSATTQSLSTSSENLLQTTAKLSPSIIPSSNSSSGPVITPTIGSIGKCRSTPPFSTTTYLFTESEPINKNASTSAAAIAAAAAQSNRNRIPLALCSQQTALSTPGASLSVDETPIMISTDEDTDQTTSLILPEQNNATTSQIISSNNDPMISGELTRSVPELEIHSNSRIRGGIHSLESGKVSTSVPSHDGLMCRHR